MGLTNILIGLVMVAAGVFGYVKWALPLGHKASLGLGLVWLFPTVFCVGLIGLGLVVIFGACRTSGGYL